jgi:hypothetical protein
VEGSSRSLDYGDRPRGGAWHCTLPDLCNSGRGGGSGDGGGKGGEFQQLDGVHEPLQRRECEERASLASEPGLLYLSGLSQCACDATQWNE